MTSQIAARLLDRIYEWMKEAQKCSSKLRRLARELESLREKCNAVETVGNTVAVLGSVVAIAAIPFTAGTSLFVGGAVAAAAGAGTTVVTKIIERFLASDDMDEVKVADRRCNQLTKEIQDLFEQLKRASPYRSENELRNHIVKEILNKMKIQLNIHEEDRIRFLDKLMTSECIAALLLGQLDNVLAMFQVEIRALLVMRAAYKQAPFLGIVAGLACLPDLIDNWVCLIKDDYETKATKSIKEAARMVDEKVEELSGSLSLVENTVRDLARKHHYC